MLIRSALTWATTSAAQNNDATFGKYPAHTGDKYVDPRRAALQAEAEQRKGNLVDKPFKMASPAKEAAGMVGSYFGTFGGKIAHEPEHDYVSKQKGNIPGSPKGIYTSPAKKGSFGMNKFTLSEKTGYKVSRKWGGRGRRGGG
jgi:hypothetical protein